VAGKARTPRAKHAEKARLTREHWLDAAFAAVVEGGFDRVRVLTLAQGLKVTRGSFYWHFGEQSELVDGLLQRWQDRQRAAHSAVDAGLATSDPQAALRRLLEAALAHAGADLEHMRFELALRGLGRRNARVAQALLEVDQQRMALFQRHFVQMTGQPALAEELATLFYLAVVGSHQALARPSNPAWLEERLRALITRHLIDAHAPRSRGRARRQPHGAKTQVAGGQ